MAVPGSDSVPDSVPVPVSDSVPASVSVSVSVPASAADSAVGSGGLGGGCREERASFRSSDNPASSSRFGLPDADSRGCGSPERQRWRCAPDPST